jgi:hypothetical protein
LRLAVEHARPLDAAGLVDLPRGDVDRLLQRLENLRARAPFQLAPPLASTTNESRDRMVRHYAASFALDVPTRATGAMATSGIADALRRIHRARPRPTDLVIVAAAPTQVPNELKEAIAMMRKKGVRVRWAAVDPRLGLDAPQGGEAVRAAIEIEVGAARKAALSQLAAAGVRVLDARTLALRGPRRLEEVAEAS